MEVAELKSPFGSVISCPEIYVEDGSEEIRKKMKMMNNDKLASVSSHLLKISVKNIDDLESITKNLLMITTSDSDKIDSDFYGKLDTGLFQLKNCLPGPINIQILVHEDIENIEYLLKLERFAELYYSQLLQCVINKVDDNNWFGRSLSNIPGCLIRLIVVDGATLTMFYESLVTICEIIKLTPNKAAKLDICVKLLEYFVKCDAVQSAYLNLDFENYDKTDLAALNGSNETKKVLKMENRKAMWNTSIQVFVSLPNRIANKLSGKFPDIFLRENFCRLCCHHIIKCVNYSVSIKMHNPNKILYIDCLSTFFSKVLINFNGCKSLTNLIRVFYLWCCSNTDVSNEYKSIINKLFTSLDHASIEVAAVLVLNYSSDSGLADISLLLSHDIIDVNGWYHALLNKLPLLSYSCGIVAIKNLVYFLGNVQKKHDASYEGQFISHGPVKNYLLSDLLLQLLTAWSDKSAITHTTVEQHIYISKIIILSINFITSHFYNCAFFNLKTYLNTIKLKLFNGLPEHLESTSNMVRAIGMITVESVVKRINAVQFSDEDNTVPLAFDYSNMTEDLLSVVNNLKELSCFEFIKELPLDSESHEILQNLLVSIDIKNEIVVDEYMCMKKEREIDAETFQPNNCSVVNMTQSIISDDEALDSDDDLAPFDLSNDVKILETKRPKYLRDLIKNLVETNDQKDPDIWRASLEACEILVYKQLPNDDISLGLELMDLLLCMDMKFYCESFDNLKFSSALAIVVVNPAETAEYLCKKFHEDNQYSISQRLFMLDLLSGGAKILSDPSNDSVKMVRESKLNMSTSSTTSEPKPSNWEEVVKERIRSKTRRIHSAKIPLAVGKKNKFAKVAGSFFFPLLRGRGKTGPGIMFRVNADTSETPDNSLLLLVHILRTCAIVMACSLNCHSAVRMAKELLEATWSLRFHCEAKIREEVICCVASIILAVPKSILKSDLFNDVMEAKLWLEQIINSQGISKGSAYEVDTKCRSFAGQVIMLINNNIICTDDLSIL